MAQKYLYSRKIAVLGFTLILSVISCGKSSDGGGEGIIVTPPITTNASFLGKVQETSYFCDEAECPNYTVAVAVNILGNVNPTWCTGTVLSNGQVLTSKSCFGEYFFESQSSCLDHVLVKTLKGEIFGCAKVLSYSQDPSDSAKDFAAKISDYVLLDVPQIKSDRYPALAEEKGSLGPSKSASIWAVDHWFEDGKEVALTHHKCFYQDKSLVSPWGKNSASPHLFLSQCELSKSARGAAVLDSNTEIMGIIHYTSKKEDLEIWDHRVLDGEVLEHYALATTLACSSISKSNYEYCDQKLFSDNKLTTLRNSIFTGFDDLDKWEAEVQEFAKSELHKYLKWTAKLRYDNTTLSYAVDFVPTCFMNGKVWLLEFRGGLFNMFYDKSGSVFKAWPKYEIYSALNKDFNAKTDLLDNGEYLYEIKFSPRDLKKDNKSDLVVINSTTQTVLVELKDVPICQ